MSPKVSLLSKLMIKFCFTQSNKTSPTLTEKSGANTSTQVSRRTSSRTFCCSRSTSFSWRRITKAKSICANSWSNDSKTSKQSTWRKEWRRKSRKTQSMCSKGTRGKWHRWLLSTTRIRCLSPQDWTAKSESGALKKCLNSTASTSRSILPLPIQPWLTPSKMSS